MRYPINTISPFKKGIKINSPSPKKSTVGIFRGCQPGGWRHIEEVVCANEAPRVQLTPPNGTPTVGDRFGIGNVSTE